jgi:hypothetical protein
MFVGCLCAVYVPFMCFPLVNHRVAAWSNAYPCVCVCVRVRVRVQAAVRQKDGETVDGSTLDLNPKP